MTRDVTASRRRILAPPTPAENACGPSASRRRSRIRYRDLFVAHRPAALLVEFDRGSFASPIVAAANALGIPTMTLVHGAIGPHGFTPPQADVVACWGQNQVATLTRQGVDAERLIVTGCARINRVPVDPADVRHRLGIDARPLALLATNNLLPPPERLQLAEIALDAVASRSGDLQIGLRVHPRESLDDYQVLLRRHPATVVLTGSAASLDESLAISDLVLCGNTSLADDALVAGVVPVLLDPEGRSAPLTVGLGVDGPVATTTEELCGVLDRWLDQPEWQHRLVEQARAAGHAVCALTGNHAAKATADALRALAGGERQTEASDARQA